ncbi:pre-peptidase C-terminal domain-containing protein [Nostoc sphaeroides CHAB 2801]|uniref:calcium-binding protein n=1 Tax=Nostoc sphaeroides TaxID=446679 RepID=UPI000E477EBA|nr:calcium-binding protein [Nostoc sphaeroides]MCC5628088.1 pre-peptidase C-terminal domain-containing protein [Nostoc sphaeroides CHAB 2801]
MAFFFGTTSPDNISGTSGNDTIVGWAGNGNANSPSGNDILNGLAGNDSLAGGTDNDTLDGGLGADSLNGGTGDDTYIVDSAVDTITEAANSGTDTVLSSVTYTLGANLENLRLTGTSAINATGNSLNNILIGTNLSRNTLNGRAGDDSIIGGSGDDILNGEEGDDRLRSGLDNDRLNGGSGDDVLISVFAGGFPGGNLLPPGLGETDTLTGGTGADRFILGDFINVYYDDNNSANPGFGDFATITDFDSSQDQIQLKGSLLDYRLEAIGNNTRIFLDKPGAEPDEIISVVLGRNNLTLDSDDFLFNFEGEIAGKGTNNSLLTSEVLGSLSSGSNVNASGQIATVQPGDNSDFDFYNFSLANSGTVTIRTVTSGDSVLGLFNDIGTLVQTDDDGRSDKSSLITSSLSAGTYSISVSKYPLLPEDGGTFSGSGSTPDFSYTLEVSVV